ncbi:uncharacterized protein C7orf78 homolog [Aplochiton taeniatus]
MKAPDFSPKLYSSLRGPRKKGRKKHPTFVLSGPTETKVKVETITQRRLPAIDQRREPPKFSTSFRPPDSFESKLMFVRTGKYPSGAYNNPKPHNFRPHEDDKPNIVTTLESDPGLLHFKSKHLSIIQGLRSEQDIGLKDTLTKMDTYKPAEPRWEATLTLPKLLWPPKSASYTRHKRRRGVYSAFMDRVQEKISGSWKNQ